MKFPIIKDFNIKTIASDLISVKPESIEELANGRIIKEYPFKYDDFLSKESLKDYIIKLLKETKNIKKEWLKVETFINLPFNIDKFSINN